MPTISFTLSAADLTKVVNALSVRYGYDPLLPAVIGPGGEQLPRLPNPQTPGEFVRLRIAQWVRDEVNAHELATAQAAVTVPPVILT